MAGTILEASDDVVDAMSEYIYPALRIVAAAAVIWFSSGASA